MKFTSVEKDMSVYATDKEVQDKSQIRNAIEMLAKENSPAEKLAALKLMAEQYPISEEECVRRDGIPINSLLESHSKLKMLEKEFELYKQAIDLCIYMGQLKPYHIAVALECVKKFDK